MTKSKKKTATAAAGTTTTTRSQDVEQQQQRAAPNNPYSSTNMPDPNLLPPLHPLNILKRGGYIGGSCYGLFKLGAHKAIFHSPRVSHEWFKIGLAGTIAILAVKAYVELYAGKLQQKKVCYDNFKQETHAVLGLLVGTSIAFHIALWPHYGTTTFLVLFLVSVILLQTMLLIPSYLQNVVSFVALTFFLQEYK